MEISIKQLSKVYKNGNKALDNIDMTIGSGMFGLLGPNGAGKSTLMQILVTLMKPTTGDVKIDNFDLFKNRKEIRAMSGYLPQNFNNFPKVKAWEFLDYSAKLAGIEKQKRLDAVDRLLEQAGLFEVRERYINKLSGGMKRRLGIAQALIGNPKILIVDEPTTGLDPEERIRFRNILTEMGREERIILLSTHIVGDISSSCSEMAILVNGKIGFDAPPDQLIEQARGHTFSIQADDTNLERIKEEYTVIATIPNEDGWQVEVVADKLKMSGKEIEPNLEHAYVYFMETIGGDFNEH